MGTDCKSALSLLKYIYTCPSDRVLASKYVIQKNQSAYNELADGIAIYDTYKGVRVGIIKTDGKFATVFPDSEFQPNALGQLIKNPKY